MLVLRLDMLLCCRALMPPHAPLLQAHSRNLAHLLSSAHCPLIHSQLEVRQCQVVEGMDVSGVRAVDGQEAPKGCLQLPSTVQVIAMEALPASMRPHLRENLPVCSVQTVQGNEGLAELLQGARLATRARLEAPLASAGACNLCRSMLWASRTLRQAERHAGLAKCAKSHKGALPRHSADSEGG